MELFIGFAILFGFVFLIFWIVKKCFDWFFDGVVKGGMAVYDANQRRNTLIHYNDHADVYFDYSTNKWFNKV